MRREWAEANDVNEAGKAAASDATGPDPDPSPVSPGSYHARPTDPIDELTGWLVDIDPVDDIDAIIYELDA